MQKSFHALIRGRMTWKYELETRGGHCIVREINARFQSGCNSGVQFCHSSTWFVADSVTPSQLAPRLTSLNHSIRSAQLLVFAPLQGNPRSEIPSISSAPWDRARPLLFPSPRLKEVNKVNHAQTLFRRGGCFVRLVFSGTRSRAKT